jgi:hypothetical protein
MDYRGPGYLPGSHDLAPSPSPPLPSDRLAIRRKTEKERQLSDGRGVEDGRGGEGIQIV